MKLMVSFCENLTVTIKVNFTPDKRLVKLHRQEQIVKTLQTLLDSNYVLQPPVSVPVLSPTGKSTPKYKSVFLLLIFPQCGY
jgi:DNA mismatch repair ATPase MutL